LSIDAAIVVSSCDLFKAVWKPFCHGLHKYWPDCPWPMVFITNEEEPPCGGNFQMGPDGGPHGWSAMSRDALERINAPVVLWIHDDNWLCAPVNNNVVASLVALFEDDLALHLIRLSNCYMSTTCGGYSRDERLRIICRDSRQRTSLQPSLWRRETMIELLVDGESPWTWEGMAPHRSRHINGDFLCCREGFRPIRFLSHVDPDWTNEAVERGKWTKSARNYCQREGIDVDFSVHPNRNPNEDWG